MPRSKTNLRTTLDGTSTHKVTKRRRRQQQQQQKPKIKKPTYCRSKVITYAELLRFGDHPEELKERIQHYKDMNILGFAAEVLSRDQRAVEDATKDGHIDELLLCMAKSSELLKRLSEVKEILWSDGASSMLIFQKAHIH